MTRRPNPFDQLRIRQALLDLGCQESFVSTAVSNYRLFVPLVLAGGRNRVYELINSARLIWGGRAGRRGGQRQVHRCVRRAPPSRTKVRAARARAGASHRTQQPRLL